MKFNPRHRQRKAERDQSVDNHQLKEVGLKATLPRLRILEILESNDSLHMSAEDVYKALLDSGEDVGLATVYRTLTQFESAGLIVRHRFEDGRAVFELDRGAHHDHMVCLRCNKVEEFVDETIERRQREIADKAGFEMTDHCLYIYGICADCRKS